MKTALLLAGIAGMSMSFQAAAQAPAGTPAAPASAGITRAAAEAQAAEQFARLDANGDGQFTPEEAEAAFAARMAERRERMEARMEALTPEQRARIEARRAERRGGAGGEARGPGGQRGRIALSGPVTLAQFKEQALARFDRLDTDRNDIVTPAEQAAARPPRGDGAEPRNR